MSLLKFFDKKMIDINLGPSSKKEAISRLLNLIAQGKKIVDKEKVLEKLFNREEKGTTGIGEGVALPHVRTSNIGEVAIAFGLSREGVDFNALDGKPAHLIFLLLGPESDNENYLRIMAGITRLVSEEARRETLLKARDPKEVICFITEREAKK